MSNVDPPDNPYASPEADLIGAHGQRDRDDRVNFSKIIRRWERLRIIYNSVLTAIVMMSAAMLFPELLASVDFWAYLLVGAAVANLCLFTGPAIEGYGTHFGLWHPAFTAILFLAGLALASILTMVTVLSYMKF